MSISVASVTYRRLANRHVLRKVAELKWNRTVNMHGRVGQNIPSDLHMEHLNRRLKMAIRSAGSNVNPAAIQHLAKSIGPVSHVCEQFEKEIGILSNKDCHSSPSFEKDFQTLFSILQSKQLLRSDSHGLYDKKPLLNGLEWSTIVD